MMREGRRRGWWSRDEREGLEVALSKYNWG